MPDDAPSRHPDQRVHPFAALLGAVVVVLDRELTRPDLDRIRTRDRRASCHGGRDDIDHAERDTENDADPRA